MPFSKRPSSRLCSRRCPRELQATPITITSGFETKEGSDAVAAAAAAGLAPELPIWISGVGNLIFFNLGDGMELSIDEMESMRLLLEIKNGIPPVEKLCFYRSQARLESLVPALASIRSSLSLWNVHPRTRNATRSLRH